MQKVVGSNPISRSQKGLYLQAFFCVHSRLVRLCLVGLTPDWSRADRRPFQGKPAVCRPILVRPNRSSSAGLQEVRCSACYGRYADSCCNGTTLRIAPVGAIPAVVALGAQSGSSPETAGSTWLAPRPRLAQVVNRPPGRHGCRRAQARAGTRLSRSLVRSAR